VSQKPKTSLLGRGPKPEPQQTSSPSAPEPAAAEIALSPESAPTSPEPATELALSAPEPAPAPPEPAAEHAVSAPPEPPPPPPPSPSPSPARPEDAAQRAYDERTGTTRHTVPAPGWSGFSTRVDWPTGQITGFNTPPAITGPCSAATTASAPAAPISSPIEVRKTATGAMHLGPEANRTYTPTEAIALAHEILRQFEGGPA
jgi:hypothetical protein